MRITAYICMVLMIVGSIVWGLIGIFDFNLVSAIFGGGVGEIFSRIIYSLVGVSALFMIVYWILYRPFSKK